MSQELKNMIPEDVALIFKEIKAGIEGTEYKAPQKAKTDEIDFNFNR